MKQYVIDGGNEGQTLLKFSAKILPDASIGFLHKNLRKKNIDINKKKCTGKEILRTGDIVHFWLSDETFGKFSGQQGERKTDQDMMADTFRSWILYEDDHIILANKPAGVLTQGDQSGDRCLNDFLLAYTGEGHGIKPSAANRLDRNTSGIVACGKTVKGLQALSEALKKRTVHKYYRAIVWGRVEEEGAVRTFLLKEHEGNEVQVTENVPGAKYSESWYCRIRSWNMDGADISEIEVELITGRSHQIRVHMASIDHPLLGDRKYGTRESIYFSRVHHISHQALHACRLEFPHMEGVLAPVSEKVFEVKPPWEN